LPDIIQPVPYRVFQRANDDTAAIDVAVQRVGDGGATVRLVDSAGAQVPVEARLEMGGGALTGSLEGVPVGGPYTLQVVSSGSVLGEAPGLLVGDLWVLAGQSNMDGVGKLFDTEPPSDRVNAFYYDDRWAVAEDPFCWYDEAVDPVHWGTTTDREAAIALARLARVAGAGLGVAFGKELDRRLGVPIGLLVCSHGGTSMAQWSPDLLDEGGNSLYGSMIRRIRAVGRHIAGIAWYQGESDANPEAAPAYADTFARFVEAVRRDVGQPGLPIVYVQIGCFYISEYGPELVSSWHQVQDAQVRAETLIPHSGMASAIDLSLHDGIHIDTPGLRRLGRRLAHVAHIVAYGASGAGAIGPRPGRNVVSEDRRTVRVGFEHVNGSLTTPGRVRGFTVMLGDETRWPTDARVDRSGSAVVLTFADPLPAGAELHYGWGLNPACGIVDERDLPVPVFGPARL